MTPTYGISVSDGHGGTSTQPVTFTVVGTNDALVIAADTSGPHTLTEQANATGLSTMDTSTATLNFTDLDLNDAHTVSVGAASAVWSGGSTLPAGLLTTLNAALSSTLNDNAYAGSGSVALNFAAADGALDFLAAGQTLSVTYNVTVSDTLGGSSIQPVTFTITGTDDASTLAAAVPDESVHMLSAFSYTVPTGTFQDVDTPTLTYSATLADGTALPT